MILTTLMQKGGVAKTTTAGVLAQAAIYENNKVLLIDLDPQANLTFMTGADTSRGNVYDLITGTPAADLIQQTPQGVYIIAGSWDIATIKTEPGSALRLKKAIDPIRNDFDLIIIDTPSQAGEIQFNALIAADALLMPTDADTYNIQALYQTIDAAQTLNPGLAMYLLFTKYDNRATINRTAKEKIIEIAESVKVIYLGDIRQAVAIREAAALQLSLYDYAPKAKPAQDYLEVLHKLIK